MVPSAVNIDGHLNGLARGCAGKSHHELRTVVTPLRRSGDGIGTTTATTVVVAVDTMLLAGSVRGSLDMGMGMGMGMGTVIRATFLHWIPPRQ
jgi:hypothetical protein